MEDDLPDLSRVQQLYETGPALLGAAGDGRLAQQLLAVGGVAGASLAGAEELRRDVSVIRHAQMEAYLHGRREVQCQLLSGLHLPAGRHSETLQAGHLPGRHLTAGGAGVVSEPQCVDFNSQPRWSLQSLTDILTPC